MWSRYTKTFAFRDCFDKKIIEDNVAGINKLLEIDQLHKNHGAYITSDTLSLSIIVDTFEAYEEEDDRSWELIFIGEDKEIAAASIPNEGEIHLCFEIEEKVETGEFKIDYCKVKTFKEYQM